MLYCTDSEFMSCNWIKLLVFPKLCVHLSVWSSAGFHFIFISDMPECSGPVSAPVKKKENTCSPQASASGAQRPAVKKQQAASSKASSRVTGAGVRKDAKTGVKKVQKGASKQSSTPPSKQNSRTTAHGEYPGLKW